jgi:alkyl hydroperoxide reductase subunit AhpC
MAKIKPEFTRRSYKLIGLSVDPVGNHGAWVRDIEETQGHAVKYPMTTGHNFDEILSLLDSMRLTVKHKVATPANWKDGDDVIIAGSVSDDDARKIYPAGRKTVKPYLRVAMQPR